MPRILSKKDVDGFRARLCAAAEELFAKHGVEAVTMRQLATALGVSAMTPYRYFKDKDAILAAVRAAAFDRFASALEAAGAGGGHPLEVSRRVGDAYADFALKERRAYQLMFDLSQPNESAYPELQKAGERARRTMSAHVRGLVEAGLLKGDPVMMGHAFWAVLHGVIVLQLAGKLAPDIDPAQVRATAFLALARGFGLDLSSADVPADGRKTKFAKRVTAS